MGVAHRGSQVRVSIDELLDAEVAQEALVLGKSGSDDVRARADGELSEEASDASGRADDQDVTSRGDRESVEGGSGAEACESRRSRLREPTPLGFSATMSSSGTTMSSPVATRWWPCSS